MKKNVLKSVLALCAVFAIGSGNLQDSWGTKPVSEAAINSFFIKNERILEAGITPPIKPISRPPIKFVPENESEAFRV